MGLLRHVALGDEHRLRPRNIVGRISTSDLHLDDARVSGEHAVIHYNGVRWEVRDLGSTNGTWVNKQRLPRGERAVLGQGARLVFGGQELSYELVDASPPVACARQIRTDETRFAADGVLELPDNENPQVQLYEGPEGRWIMDSSDAQRPVADREVVIVDGEGWSLELPDLSTATLDTARLGPILETVTLRFHLSPDEEHLSLTLLHDSGELPLGTRQYHLPLLQLARAWLADPGAPAEERGWVERDDLCRALAVDANKLNVDIYRARKQLIGLGVLGAANVVLRRVDTGHLRLGVQGVEIFKGGVREIPSPRAATPPPPPAAAAPPPVPQRATPSDLAVAKIAALTSDEPPETTLDETSADPSLDP